MENTINTAAEATIEAVNKINFRIPEPREWAIFGLGVAATLFTEKVAIPAGKKVVDKIKAKTGKKKPIEVAAEVVEIEE